MTSQSKAGRLNASASPQIRKKTSRPISKTLLAQSIGLSIGILAATSAIAAEGNPRVNQIGYLPTANKIATYVTSSDSRLTWELRDGDTVISSGLTDPKGNDPASGQKVHHINFATPNVTGSNFRLVVGGDESYPFDILADSFSGVSYDAIKYFYHNRSGIEIKTEYTGGGLGSFANDAKWSRPAGHLNQGANKGDFNVACWPGTCNYSLDVPYGWYDAGDHGKYVVNGGISVFKLANMYEAALHLRGTAARFADGTLNIPESGNGISDVLDEIRWQMEFMLAMQVPDNQDKAGMAHHKISDENWTGLPLPPHQDTQTRYLTPPSTAATLNLAASAAQCSRLFAEIDPSFANKCKVAAEKAWNAAQQNPNVILPASPYNNGSGGYGDTVLEDEFLWAAAELYISTGKSTYLADINIGNVTSTDYGWQNVSLAALMSLATVPTPHTSSLMTEARQKLKQIAELRVDIANSEGYLTPINEDEFYWGSNNGIANSLSVIGLVYDFTGEEKFAEAVGYGVNYLFGQNALSNSYVTGHGENRSKQPHHRFWAGAQDGSFPWAPPGALVGGPNSGLEDDISRNALDGCQTRPQTCYIDDIGAWSTNEITINWNSSLAWVLAFWDDYSKGSEHSPSVSISSPVSNQQFASGSDVLVTTESSDVDGEVISMHFYVDNRLELIDFDQPFEYLITGLNDGQHNIKVQARDNDDNMTESTPVSFSIGELPNTDPVAAFTRDVNGLTVTLDASGSDDPDGQIANYSWDLGDGSVATDKTVTHTYLNDQEVTVTLTVTDDRNATDVETQTFIVAGKPPVELSCAIVGQPKFNIWNTGAIIRDVEAKNTSNSVLNGWSVQLDAHTNVSIVDAWGGTATASGSLITVSGNNTLSPGQSIRTTIHISHGGDFNGADCTDSEAPIPPTSFDISIEAEDFTSMSGIQTEPTSDIGGGTNVGWIDTGDWMAFAPIIIPETADYIVEYRVASNTGGGNMQLKERSGSPVYGSKSFTLNRGWQGWETVSHTVRLSAGQHELMIEALQGGFNLNWFRIKSID
jgi:endoglucanase